MNTVYCSVLQELLSSRMHIVDSTPVDYKTVQDIGDYKYRILSIVLCSIDQRPEWSGESET
jgi:hypothetical protein